MLITRLITIGTLALVALPTFAGNDTRELLNSTHVRKQVVLSKTSDSFAVAIDGDSSVAILQPEALVANSRTRLYYHAFNPLTTKIKVTQEHEVDKNYDLSALIAALQAIAPAIGLPGKSTALADKTKFDDLLKGMPKALENCLTLNQTLLGLRDAIDNEQFTADQLATIVKKAALGYSGVKDAASDLKNRATELNEHVSQLQAIANKIDEIVNAGLGIATSPGATISDDCKKAYHDNLNLTMNVQARLVKVIAERTKIAESLAALQKELQGFANPDKWANATNAFASEGDRAELNDDFLLVDIPSPVDRHIVNVEVTERLVALGKNGVTDEAKDARSAQLVYRYFGWGAPEIGVAALSSDLKAPQYGTSTNGDGQMVVTRLKDKDNPITAALMFNYLLRAPITPTLSYRAASWR